MITCFVMENIYKVLFSLFLVGHVGKSRKEPHVKVAVKGTFVLP